MNNFKEALAKEKRISYCIKNHTHIHKLSPKITEKKIQKSQRGFPTLFSLAHTLS